jgi:hypothetical protein
MDRRLGDRLHLVCYIVTILPSENVTTYPKERPSSVSMKDFGSADALA